jgi:hypothetical protein
VVTVVLMVVVMVVVMVVMVVVMVMVMMVVMVMVMVMVIIILATAQNPKSYKEGEFYTDVFALLHLQLRTTPCEGRGCIRMEVCVCGV